MRFVSLLLLVLSFSAQCLAQADGREYIDALWLKGPVSHVTMHCEESNGAKTKMLDVDYDYTDSSRTVTTYTLNAKGERKVLQKETEMLKKNPKEDKEITYSIVDNKIVQCRYSFDEYGNKTVTNVVNAKSPDLKKRLYSFYGNRNIFQRIDYKDKQTMESISKFVYDSTGKSLVVEQENTLGKKISTSHFAYDAEHNLIDYSIVKAGSDTAINYSYKYGYDMHGNYTICKYYVNGVLIFRHYRDIKYK